MRKMRMMLCLGAALVLCFAGCSGAESGEDKKQIEESGNKVSEEIADMSQNTDSPESDWDLLVSEKGIDGAVKCYIDAHMKAGFLADYEAYVSYNMDSREGAEALHENEINYYTDCLIYQAEITEEYVTDEVRGRIQQVAEDALAKVKWEVKSVDVDESKVGSITLALYPTDYFYVMSDAVFEASEEFYEECEDVDSEEELVARMVTAMEESVDSAEVLEAVERVYEVDLNEGVLSEEAWIDVDDVIMNLMEEE